MFKGFTAGEVALSVLPENGIQAVVNEIHERTRLQTFDRGRLGSFPANFRAAKIVLMRTAESCLFRVIKNDTTVQINIKPMTEDACGC